MNWLLYWITGDERMPGMDTLTRVSLDARMAPWAILLLALCAVALSIVLYQRAKTLSPIKRALLIVLRAAALIALLLLLAEPSLRVEGECQPPGEMPLVLDRTESMSIAEGMGRPVRLASAHTVFQQVVKDAGSQPPLKVMPYLYDEHVTALNAEQMDVIKTNLPPVGNRTSFRAMIGDSFRDHRGAYVPGMVVLTDGGNNVAEPYDDIVEELVHRRVPLYFVAMGLEHAPAIVADRIDADDIVFVQEKTKAFFAFHQFGFTGKPLPVTATFGKQHIDLSAFAPQAEGDQSVPIEFVPEEEGVFDLDVSIPQQPNENSSQNHRLTRHIRVIKDRIRVLCVFGAPSWEYRFLEGAFQRDRRVTYAMYLQSADRRLFRHPQEHLIEKLPEKAEDLSRNYDIVLFSRIDLHSLSKDFLEFVHSFVSDGGGSVGFLSDGADIPFSAKGTKFEQMLPVRLLSVTGDSDFRQEMFKSLDMSYRFDLVQDSIGNPLTTFDPVAEKNAAIWSGFPPCYEMVSAVEPKASAITLMNARVEGEGKRIPAIVYHNYGRGLALYMGFDSTWRWRKIYGDRYFRDYWGKVVQFLGLPHLLGESAQARLMLDRLSAGVGERVVVTSVVRNNDFSPLVADSVGVSARDDTGKEKRLRLSPVKDRPGLFRGNFYPEKPGKYTLALPPEFKADSQELKAEIINLEFQDSGTHLALMARLAERTGGLVFVPGEGNTPTNSLAGVNESARANRETALMKAKNALLSSGKNVFADEEYVHDWAQHILATVAERRARQSVVVEMNLLDSNLLMWLAGLLFCIEYLFRKIWFLD